MPASTRTRFDPHLYDNRPVGIFDDPLFFYLDLSNDLLRPLFGFLFFCICQMGSLPSSITTILRIPPFVLRDFVDDPDFDVVSPVVVGVV